MFELSYQLYSSREFSPLSDTLKMLAEIGYTQVEGFGGVYNDLPVLAAGLKAHGLTMSTGHFGLEMLENEPDKVLEIASAVGMKAIYCPHFVYDYQGNNLVHPKQPWRIGKNWWELTNKDGNRVIKNLIEQARAGGGFHRYVWNKPSSGERVEKISYAIALDKWGWMLGTGIYIDDVVNQVEKFKVDINNRVERVFIIILAIAAVAG